jgi:hypothetical protein
MSNSMVPDSQYAVRAEHAKAVTVQCNTLDNFCETNGINRIGVL